MIIRRQTESKQAKCPRGKGPSRLHRVKMGVENTKLYDWARRRLRLREVPVYNRALAGKHRSYFTK